MGGVGACSVSEPVDVEVDQRLEAVVLVWDGEVVGVFPLGDRWRESASAQPSDGTPAGVPLWYAARAAVSVRTANLLTRARRSYVAGTRACRSASAAAAVRLCTPSLSYMCSRCLSTVRGLRKRVRAISSSVFPWARRASTSASRLVNPKWASVSGA